MLIFCLFFALPLRSSPMPARGATLPFITYHASDAATNGELLGPDRTVGTIAAEASGRKAVRLNAPGQQLSFKASAAANSIVVRYAIPDGENGSLSLYIDGAFRQKLNLTSKYSWAYGGWAIPYSKDPSAGRPVHFFDETRALCGDIAAGATVMLRLDAGDWIVVDLVDLEQAAPPERQPEGSLSVADYGAKGDGTTDDSKALQACIDAAHFQKKAAWIGPGTYVLTESLAIPPVTLQGAGIWHTTLHQINDLGIFNMKLGGESCHLSDFTLMGEVTNRHDNVQDNALNGHAGINSTLRNVWIEHTKCGWWVGGPGACTEGLKIEGCRFRNLYADGVNFCNGTSRSVITNCHFRNTGDDAMASWSPTRSGLNMGNLFSFNTVQCPWRANCAAIYGGEGNRIEDNIFEDTSNYPGILIGAEFHSHAFSGVTSVRRNTLLRCGGTFNGANHGALKISADQGDVSGIECNDLEIVDSTFSGIMLQGPHALHGAHFSGVEITGGGGLNNPAGLEFKRGDSNKGW